MTTDQMSPLIAADPAGVLESDRRHYFRQVEQTAEIIAANALRRPIVLLAGPSGSGKTTTALLIERELERRGLQTHTLQMDDYFSPLSEEEKQLLRENKLDLEKPTRVDIPFFQQQLDEILAGSEIRLPHYNFRDSRREFDGRTLRRRPGELVIMEGIHALNPMVTGHAADTTRVYVSVRTRVTASDGKVLHPSKIRLARRLLRDRTGRGRPLSATIGMRPRVDAGEQMYIMPFKQHAHCSIDSFYSIELSIYRPYLLDDLRALLPEYPDLADLVQVMQELPSIPSGLLPRDSLLREFVGGSELPY